jgi:hypothetical protein
MSRFSPQTAILLSHACLLTACATVPTELRGAVLDSFHDEEEPRIHSAIRASLAPEDRGAGVDEVWCIDVTRLCYDCAQLQLIECTSARLAWRIGDEWQVTRVVSEDDWEAWQARGCRR